MYPCVQLSSCTMNTCSIEFGFVAMSWYVCIEETSCTTFLFIMMVIHQWTDKSWSNREFACQWNSRFWNLPASCSVRIFWHFRAWVIEIPMSKVWINDTTHIFLIPYIRCQNYIFIGFRLGWFFLTEQEFVCRWGFGLFFRTSNFSDDSSNQKSDDDKIILPLYFCFQSM